MANGAKLRILAAKPPAECAILETTTLEDVFLYYAHEHHLSVEMTNARHGE